MKNIYFTTALALLFTAYGFSQITVTGIDLLSKADTIRMTQASTVGIPDPKLTGTNYTWNYDSLKPVLQYVDTFVAVTSTPLLYQFYFNNGIMYPKYKASFAQKTSDLNVLSQIQLTNTYNYFQNNSNGYSIVGFGSTVNGAPVSVKYDSIDVIYKFPMNYGNSDSSVSNYLVNIPTLGAFGQHQKRVNKVEGWGSLTTPYGTFNTLKVKSTLNVTDTIYYSGLSFGTKIPLPVSYQYKWIANNEKVPVLEIDVNNIGVVTRVTYRDSMRAGVMHVGVNEIAADNNLRIFPNPATNAVFINYTAVQPGIVKLELLDVYGRVVETLINQKQQSGQYAQTVDIGKYNLAAGIYFARLVINQSVSVVKLKID
ncbi:MAG: T9SS type A sorting domain-containing protein [Bacteroidia bacterium]|nr:T9SS type A sorting domain-containing protein [Bacteroidia bacterium]